MPSNVTEQNRTVLASIKQLRPSGISAHEALRLDEDTVMDDRNLLAFFGERRTADMLRYYVGGKIQRAIDDEVKGDCTDAGADALASGLYIKDANGNVVLNPVKLKEMAENL